MDMKIALAGNPNCGKTTLFNDLTGSNQYVGNWPGVTVEKKEGRLKGRKDIVIQDLPGIYSLSPYTLEEVVARNYLVKEKPDAILNIVDGTNIERNLYLTTQLIELGLPVVVAVNMMDLVRRNGDQIDARKLSDALGCQVVEISALKGEGGVEAAELAAKMAQQKRAAELPHVFTGSVEHAIAHIEESIQGMVDDRYLRWYAVKVFERDEMTDENMAPYTSEWKILSTENEQENDDGILHFHTVGAGNLNGLRFILHRGECVTLLDKENKIAGDMMDLMTGKMRCKSGWITVDHVTYTQKKAGNYLDEGIAVIPADGVNRLLFLEMSYMENLTFLLDRKLKKSLIPGKIYKSIHSEYRPIAGPVIDAPCVRDIPQEDQFALLYHKMNLLRPRVMICIQPLAKGDMFCRMKILNALREIQKQGTAILMITSSVSDTMDISDRLLVVEQGKVAASYDRSEFKRIVR